MIRLSTCLRIALYSHIAAFTSSGAIEILPEGVLACEPVLPMGDDLVWGWILEGYPLLPDTAFVWTQERGFEELTFLEDYFSPTILGVYAEGDVISFRENPPGEIPQSIYVHDRRTEKTTVLLRWNPASDAEVLVSDDRHSIAFRGTPEAGTVEAREAGFHIVTFANDGSHELISIPSERYGSAQQEVAVAVSGECLVSRYGNDETDDWTRYIRRIDLKTGESMHVGIPGELDSEYLVLGPVTSDGRVYGYSFYEYGPYENFFEWSMTGGFRRLDRRVAAVTGEEDLLLNYTGRLSDEDMVNGWPNPQGLELGFSNGVKVEWQSPALPEGVTFDHSISRLDAVSPNLGWAIGSIQYVGGSDDIPSSSDPRVVWDRAGRCVWFEEFFPAELANSLSCFAAEDLSHLVFAEGNGYGVFSSFRWMGGDELDQLHDSQSSVWPITKYPYRDGGWHYIHDGPGWVYDLEWPWIYYPAFEEWTWASWQTATVNAMWLYRADSQDWVWIDHRWDGWVYLSRLDQWVHFQA